jgi:integrase
MLSERMPRSLPLHLYREPSRHGTTRYYVRKGHGPRTKIKADYDTPEFWREYQAALATPQPAAKKEAAKGTLEWGLDRFRESSAWSGLSNATRRQSENIYRKVIAKSGTELLKHITAAHILAGREKRKATPHAANNFLKSMRRFFQWAADPNGGNMVKKNPTIGVTMLAGKNKDGFHTWTPEEIVRYEARWPVGTQQRLAFDIMQYTGLARGDVVRLGRQHIADGIITLRMEKPRGDGVVYPPVSAPLATSIAATKTGDLTFLINSYGTKWVKESFGNWFRDQCREAGCPGSAHGIRKAAATLAAENGATVSQLMALFGWASERIALQYARKAERKRLAAAAGKLLLR